MKTGSSTIDWDRLNKSVDPQFTHMRDNIGTNVHGAEIGIRQTRENSMDGLNEDQQTIIDKLLERYADVENNEILIAECEQQMKEYIVEQYNKEPAMYNGTKLPLEYDRFRYQSQAEKECYYKNPWHSAYRYFNFYVDKKPNPWQSPNARHTARYYDPSTGRNFQGPNIPEREMAILHGMWMALNDGEFAISDMHTPETAKAELCKTLGSLGRAHNWDSSRPVYEEVQDSYGQMVRRQKTRYKNDGSFEYVTEEYDDNEGDKPTCPWGVQTRLTQFVMLALKQDPNERPLREATVRDKFREEWIAENDNKAKNTTFNVIDKMDLATLTQTKDALINYVAIVCGDFDELEEEEKTLLRNIQPYTTEDLAAFIRDCKDYYGDFRFTQKLSAKIEYLTKRYDNYGKLLLGIAQDPWGVFYDAINERIEKQIADLKAKLPQTAAITIDAPLKEAIAAPVQNIEVVRQQLQDLAVQMGNLQLLNQLTSGNASADFIRQTAAQYNVAEMASQPEVKPEIKPEAQTISEEDMREWVIQYAIEHELAELAEEMLDAPLGDLKQFYDALKLSQNLESTNTAAEVADVALENAPKPFLAVFDAQRQQVVPVTMEVKVLPDLAAKFVSEPAKQILAVLNQNQEAARIVNEASFKLADTLVYNSAKFAPTVIRYTPEQVVELLTKMQLKLQPQAQALRV